MLIVLDNVKGNLPKRSQAIHQWPYLRKISIKDDNNNENSGITGKGVLHLLHIAQRSPQLRELYIIGNSHFGRILSLNVELGILLTSQLEVLYFTEKNFNCSLADLVQIINSLFSHSSSSPMLKQLRLDFGEHPSSWFPIDHFVEEIEKILNRFPALIHLTLHCTHGELFFNKLYNLSELAQESYIRLLLSRSNMNGRLSYRNKSNSFDIWL
ncbi:unnamed protein product [Rotaria sp. Silwood2]|nr:unnamed protein product [Rotaria sp. Silwood2]CAF4479098.1 unnamed protein product [Rotaria sp. Silwood2]